MIVADHASLYAIVLFTIGLAGLLARRELFARLVSIEIILAAALLLFVSAGRSASPVARPAPGEAIGFVVIVLSLVAAAFGAALTAAPGGVEEADEDDEKPLSERCVLSVERCALTVVR